MLVCAGHIRAIQAAISHLARLAHQESAANLSCQIGHDGQTFRENGVLSFLLCSLGLFCAAKQCWKSGQPFLPCASLHLKEVTPFQVHESCYEQGIELPTILKTVLTLRPSPGYLCSSGGKQHRVAHERQPRIRVPPLPARAILPIGG